MGGLTSPSVKASVLAAASRTKVSGEEMGGWAGSEGGGAGGSHSRRPDRKQRLVLPRAVSFAPPPPRRTMQALLQFMM